MLQVKPFCQWEKLDMTALERRKLFCSVTFHIVAITCVVWSLYVLIDRTAEEIRNGELQWPFWTKLVVVAIGFTGGLVFMYIQCKVYVHLCRKWKAYNRTIVVQVSCIHIFFFFSSFILVEHCYCHSVVEWSGMKAFFKSHFTFFMNSQPLQFFLLYLSKWTFTEAHFYT